MEWVIWGLFGAIFVWYVVSRIYNSRNHMKYDSEKLRKNAKVIDIKYKTVGPRGDYKYRTTVTFDDSLQFISHYTERENHFGYYEISLSQNLKREIYEDAIEAHAALAGNPITYENSTHCEDCKVRLPKCTNCPICGRVIPPKE